ncbi:hypothetical protein L484_025141 [Morus notabilis]|uniref:Uncharacterized protein n=1 Tax=Morus notabilis TaxID=981085 RepID=W9RZL4_9ROSA|nr:hypothetical protein L484_025141 [Morus notabilis]
MKGEKLETYYSSGGTILKFIGHVDTRKCRLSTAALEDAAGWLLNVDASVLPQLDFVGVGGLVHDSSGFVLGAFAKKLDGKFSVIAAKCLAASVFL